MSWRHTKQIVSVSCTVLMLVISLAAIFAMQQGTKFLSIQSGSMAPAIGIGDLVVVNRVPDNNYKVGDVITFINPKDQRQTITHRIQRVLPSDDMRPKRFITKGDANTTTDTPVYLSKVVGAVSFSVPYLGYAFDFVRNPIGLLLAIYVPALSIIVSELKRLIKYYKEQEPYIASGFDPKKSKPSQTKRVAKAAPLAAIAAAAVIAPAVHAALLSTAALTDNAISSAQTLNHPVISRVTFGSSSSSTTNVNIINNNSQTATSGNATNSGNGSGGTATTGNASNTSNQSINFGVSGSTTPPTVTIYNPTASPVDVSGWTLTDNTSTRTIPANTVIASKAGYVFTWPQSNGLSKLGDRLILRNTAAAIDAISWGSDTSQINPAILINSSSASLTRSNPHTDTDSATDWQAS